MYSQAVVSLVFMRSSCSSEPRQLMDGDMNDIQWRSTSSGEHGLKASDAGVIEWHAKTCAREASGVEVLGVPHSARKGSRPRLRCLRQRLKRLSGRREAEPVARPQWNRFRLTAP